MAERQYKVFLSYSHEYRADAERLVRALGGRGLLVDWDDLLPLGLPWMPELEARILSSDAVIVLIGPGPKLEGWQLNEIEIALDQQTEELKRERNWPVIPVLLPGAKLTSKFVKRNHALALKSATADATEIEALVAAVHGTVSSQQKAAAERIIESVCPYRGLLPFREEDAEFFCGRDDVILSLEEALEKSPAVALAGSSGSGKSSVVHAGLIPRLRKQRDGKVWSFVTLRPSDRPFRAVASTLISLSEAADTTAVDRVRKINELTADLESSKLNLADLLEEHRKKTGVARLLLVVDPWEDLYTLCKDEEIRQKFVDQISRVVSAQPLTTMICTLRRDFLTRALAEPGLGDRLKSSLVHLPPMNEQQRRAAVVEPAGKVGLAFQDGLVDRILDDVGDEPGQLSLLELVLTQLWEKREGTLLSFKGYDELGEASGAIARHAEKFFTSLDEQSQENARRVFLTLVRSEEETEDTRRRVHLQELGMDWQDTLQRLVSAHLLTTSLVSGNDAESALDESEATVEIVHEALLSSWSRLREWLDEYRDFLLWRERLRTSLSSWEHAGQNSEFLLTRAPLFEAHEWFLRRGTDLTEAERAFVRASWRKHQEREVARERRRKILLGAALVFAALCLCLAIFVFWRWRISFSRALAAQAAGLHEGPRDIALLLALQAERTYDTPEARSSLLGLLEESQSLQAFLPGHKGPVTAVAYSPDGSTFATAGRDTIFLWDAATGKRLDPPLVGHSGRILGLAFKDRSTLASSGDDQTIQLWQVGNHQRLQAPLKVDRPLRNLAFSPDGLLLAASSGKSIYLWDYPSLRPRETTLSHASWVSSLAFRRDSVLASASRDSSNRNTITLWNPALGTKISSFFADKAHQILALAFSPRAGSQVLALASAGADGTVRLWNSTTGEPLGEPREAHSDMVTSLAFSQDGKRLASAGRDHEIHLWDVEKEQWDASNRHPIQTLIGQGRAIWALAFGADGHLVSGGDEGAVVLWNLAAPSRFIAKAPGITGEIDSVAFSPDGQTLFVGGKDGTLRQWDTVSQQVLGKVSAHKGRIAALVLQRQSLISAGGEDGRILLWDATDLRTAPQPFEGSTDGNAIPIGSLALSADGRTVAAGDDASSGPDGRVRLWRADTRQFLGELAHRIPSLLTLALDQHGKLLATGNLRGEIQLWDVQSRRPVGKPLKGDDLNILNITSLAFNPKGDILASSRGDNTVWLWSMKSRQPLLGSPLTGPKGVVTNLAFSPGGDRIAASSLDGTVFLWDVKSRSAIGTGLQGEGSLLNVAFRPEDDYLVSGTDQSLLLFDLHYSILQAMACKIVQRGLTEAERGRFLHRDLFYGKVCPDGDKK